MSGGPGTEILQLKEDDVVKFLLSGTHLGSQNLDFQMRSYIYKRKPDGVYIFNLRKTWEKLLMAARILVAIENPGDVCVISARPYSQRAILKFAAHTGATPIAGRFTPGTFTNQIQAAFREPRVLIISDSRIDHQAVTEASYVNIPVIAFCNTDSPLRHIDVAIPCNNKGAHSIGLMWWMLAREVLRMRGTIGRESPWDVMVDLYFYRDPEEAEKEEVTAAAGAEEGYAAIQAPHATTTADWAQTPQTDAPGEASDWATISSAEVAVPESWGDSAPAGATTNTTTTATTPAASGFGGGTTTDWGADDWSAPTPQPAAAPAPAPAPTEDWGGAPAAESDNW